MPKEKALIKNNILERFAWVDCCKAMAIIAVLVDHTNGSLYTNQYITRASYYSVGLFVLLSGITHAILKPERLTFQSRLKKVGLLFVQYAVACFLITIIYKRFFDLSSYITALFSFNLQGPFYFFVFFFQLLLVAPALVMWCRYCDARKWRYLFHVLTILVLFCLASISIRYTYILPVHGGGKYLFGGTYIVLFYIGIVLGQCGILSKFQNHCIPVFAGSLLAWVVCVYSVDGGGNDRSAL